MRNLSNIVLPITLVATLGVGDNQISTARPSDGVTVGTGAQLTSADHDSIADLINTLPQWPTEGEIAPEQWTSLCRVAWSLQELSSGDLFAVLTRFMEKYAPGVDDQTPIADDPRTRPLMLLRIMFDLSKPTTDDVREIRADRDSRRVQQFGGYSPIAKQGNWSETELLTMPVGWNDNGPWLLARRGLAKNQVGGEPRRPYEPQFEALHFARFYYPRTQLGQFLGLECPPQWRTLIQAK